MFKRIFYAARRRILWKQLLTTDKNLIFGSTALHDWLHRRPLTVPRLCIWFVASIEILSKSCEEALRHSPQWRATCRRKTVTLNSIFYSFVHAKIKKMKTCVWSNAWTLVTISQPPLKFSSKPFYLERSERKQENLSNWPHRLLPPCPRFTRDEREKPGRLVKSSSPLLW